MKIEIYLISKGTKTLIISSKDTRFGASKLKFVNDLDLDGEVIYFIDTSNERDVSEALQEHAEAQPRGRLFVRHFLSIYTKNTIKTFPVSCKTLLF